MPLKLLFYFVFTFPSHSHLRCIYCEIPFQSDLFELLEPRSVVMKSRYGCGNAYIILFTVWNEIRAALLSCVGHHYKP